MRFSEICQLFGEMLCVLVCLARDEQHSIFLHCNIFCVDIQCMPRRQRLFRASGTGAADPLASHELFALVSNGRFAKAERARLVASAKSS